MKFPMPPAAVRTIGVIIVAGVLLGVGWALRPALPWSSGNPTPSSASPASFGTYFLHFFPGRAPEGSRPGANTPLVRASRFYAGERVAVRYQTAPGQQRAFTTEVRFLSADTGEETPALSRLRARFKARIGLRTFCCIRMPSEAGEYQIGVLVGDAFITRLPITVREAPAQSGGGLFAPSNE